MGSGVTISAFQECKSTHYAKHKLNLFLGFEAKLHWPENSNWMYHAP